MCISIHYFTLYICTYILYIIHPAGSGYISNNVLENEAAFKNVYCLKLEIVALLPFTSVISILCNNLSYFLEILESAL